MNRKEINNRQIQELEHVILEEYDGLPLCYDVLVNNFKIYLYIARKKGIMILQYDDSTFELYLPCHGSGLQEVNIEKLKEYIEAD